MRSLTARGAAAGAVAGLASAAWSLALVEPVLERAVALEGPADGPVSRSVQRLVGLPVGSVLVGVALGLLFSLAYRLGSPATPTWHRSMATAGGAFLALALVPGLVYPPNPPGVGSPDTVGERTTAYLLAVALGVVVVLASHAALRDLARRGVPQPLRQSAVVVAACLIVAFGYVLLPAFPDPVDAPATLVWDFRIRSLGSLAVLYAVLGAVFAILSTRAERPSPRASVHS